MGSPLTEQTGRGLGVSMGGGGSPCHMSSLRNGHVSCHIFLFCLFDYLSYMKSSSDSNTKKTVASVTILCMCGILFRKYTAQGWIQ